MRLSDPQKAVILFMQQGHAARIRYYGGEVGTDGRGSGLYFMTGHSTVTRPKLTYPIVSALTKKGMLKEDDGEFVLTDTGRAYDTFR